MAVTLMKGNPELAPYARGHTGDQGADDYNLELSQQRAQTMAFYLGFSASIPAGSYLKDTASPSL